MQKTSLPIVAGILDIISGVSSLVIAILLLLATVSLGRVMVADIWPMVPGYWWSPEMHWFDGTEIALTVLVVLTVIAFVAGSLALVGGVFALMRRHWGLVLTGSIFALIPTAFFGLLGLVAVILTALSKNEFE